MVFESKKALPVEPAETCPLDVLLRKHGQFVATHYWNWKPRLSGEKNRKNLRLRILVRGGRNSALIELEDGEVVVCSRNCLRRIKENTECRT